MKRVLWVNRAVPEPENSLLRWQMMLLSDFDQLEKISAVLYNKTEEISARGAEMKALVSPLLAEPEEEKQGPDAVLQEEEPKAADGETEEVEEPEGEAETEAAATVLPIIDAIRQRRKRVI